MVGEKIKRMRSTLFLGDSLENERDDGVMIVQNVFFLWVRPFKEG